MVIRTPWQFGDRSDGTDDDNRIFPKLRVEHPSSKLDDPQTLNIHGISRQASSAMSKHGMMNLPNIPDGIEVHVGDDRNKIRLPVFGNTTELTDRIESRLTNRSRLESSGGRSSNTFRNRMSVVELEKLLREKMKNGYFSIKNLFISYNSNDKGDVERESFHRILSTFLCVSLSYSQFNRIMKRLGFEDAKTITFDDLYERLRQTKKEESEYPSWFRHNEGISTKTQTATEVHSKLKMDAEKNISDLLLRLQMNDSEHIVKLVFYDRLKSNGYNLSDKEFEKLWLKYDEAHVGVLQVKSFIDKITSRHGNSTNNANNVNNRNPSRTSRCTTAAGSYSDNGITSDRDQCISVEKWLAKKFCEGCHDMLHAFKEFEIDDAVTRNQFLMVLREYGLVLNEDKLDAFLTRCGLAAGQRIDYKRFLKVFQQRGEGGVVQRIMKDPKHKYHDRRNRPDDERSIVTSISSIEGQLLHMFQKDYFALLDKLRSIDQKKTNTVTEIEFRAALQSFFNMKFTDGQFKHFTKTVPQESNGKVKYLEFLAKFDNERDKSALYETCSSVDDQIELFDRPTTTAYTPSSFYDDHNHIERTGTQLQILIKNLLREKFQEIEKRFYEMDVQNTKRMTKEMLRKLLYRAGLKISTNEMVVLWRNMLTDQRGTLEFQQFVRHYGYSLKSAAFPNAKKNPPVRGDSDFRILSNRFNSWKDLIQDFAKVSLENNYSLLKKQFEEIAGERSGFVSETVFKTILKSACKELTGGEINIIVEKLSSSKSIFWPEFIKHLRRVRIVSRTGHNMKDIMKHPQPVALNTITEKPMDGTPYHTV